MVKNWGEEKMNWRGGRGRLKASFTDGFTDGYKINYYFNLFCWWCVKNPSVTFEFRTKFFNGAPYFSQSVGKMTRSEMHLMNNPLIFARSVGNCVGKIERVPTDLSPSVRPSGCGGITSNCFRTLCETPTDLSPSVWPSVMWWHYQ